MGPCDADDIGDMMPRASANPLPLSRDEMIWRFSNGRSGGRTPLRQC
ncbi:hypothetical protein M2345_000919 [Sphingobium sp. B8D3D]|nr:hypothetical protein [Sphingobium sp. B8D3D]MCW2416548.1 hypothetical protein [Sphingobium sp. B8D3A]